MKAMVYKKYGDPDVLQLEEVEKPTPDDNEILIKIYASSVTAADWRIRGSIFPVDFWLLARLMFGLIKPTKTILGQEFAGVVEKIGKEVKLFKEGDQVFGIDSDNFGAYAQYKSISEDRLVAIKPDNITFEEASVVCFGGMTALIFLRDLGKIKQGNKILIYGDSGSVGTSAVQLAKYYNAHVTGVCSSSNIEMVQSLGADHVIDYTKEDFTKNSEKYDIIFDTVGKTTFSNCKTSLKENGRYIITVAGLAQYAQMLWTSIVGNKKLVSGVAYGAKNDILFLQELIEKGYLKSVIDTIYPLEQTAEAHRYAEQGHKKGNVVITLQEDSV